jgi:HEAT repeat protein
MSLFASKTEKLLRGLQDPDGGKVLKAAIELDEIGKTGDEKLINPLIHILDSEYRWIPLKMVAFILGDIGDQNTLRALQERLDHFIETDSPNNNRIDANDFIDVLSEAIEKIRERIEPIGKPRKKRDTLRDRIARGKYRWG